MMCEKCTERVKKAFDELSEVETVSVDLDSKKVVLELRKDLTNEQIRKIIEDLGFEVEF